MPRTRATFTALLAASVLLLAAAACSPSARDSSTAPAASGAPSAPSAAFADLLPLRIGSATVQAQIAVLPHEQATGLMHRDALDENAGMLFPYRQPQQLSFWMKNTRIPLEIGFFDSAGVLRERYRMFPFDTTSTRSRNDQLRFALEVNPGWFERNGVRVGDAIDLDSLASALRARGANPADYGLADK